jgi:hypothetical protein
MQIAYEVRARQLQTWVPNNNECASMCSIIWMGGTTRYYGDKSKIGFHGVFDARSDKNGKIVKESMRPSSSGNAVVGAYYRDIGLPVAAIYALTDASPSGMFWLTREFADKYQIKVERFN